MSELLPLPQRPVTDNVRGGRVFTLRRKRDRLRASGLSMLASGSFQRNGVSDVATSSIEFCVGAGPGPCSKHQESEEQQRRNAKNKVPGANL